MKGYINNSAKQLFQAITNISDIEECAAFFEDLCTIKELHDMAQRFDTAILLDRGCNYQKISEQVNVSTATISRVNRALMYGADGYRTAIAKLKETENTNDDQ